MRIKKVYVVVDDTDNLFNIKDRPSVFMTKQEATENCIYAERVKEANIIYQSEEQ